MKKLVILIISLLFCMMNSNGKEDVKLPDFNFPKNVIKDAEAQLKTALAAADGEAMVDALIRYSLAKSMLSEETFGEVTKKINEVLAREKREDYRALLLYLLSEVYDTHDDSAEADSCRALIFENDEPLKKYKIENYQKIIKSNALGRRLCPTLRDFLRYKHEGAKYLAENIEDGELMGFRMLIRYDLDVVTDYNELRAYVEKYPNSPWVNDVKNRIIEIEAQSANVRYPGQWHSTMPVTMEVSSKNARNVRIDIYRLPKTTGASVKFSSLKKILSRNVTFESDTVLFNKSQEVVFDPLPEGDYHVDVVVNGKSDHRDYIYPHNCLNINNAAKYEINDPNIPDSVRKIYVDIKSGEFLREEMEKRRSHFGKSNASLGDLNLFTDLGIYRPGETLHYTLLYKEKTRETRRAWADQTFRIELRDTQGKEIASDTLTTDRFGQLTGEFLIPTDRQNGRFSLYAENITDDGTPTSRSIGVTVSEYKTPTFYIDLSENPRSFEKDKDVTLRGEALTYSGIPLANAEVKVDVSRSFFWFRHWHYKTEFEPLQLTAKTNGKGEFSLNISKEQMNTTFGHFKASFMVTDDAGESQEAHTYFFVGSKRSLIYNGETDFIIDKPITLPISLMSSEPDEKSATFKYAIYESRDSKVVLKKGTLTTDAPQLDLRDLKSGTYYLEAGFKIDEEKDEKKPEEDDDDIIFEEIVLYHSGDTTCPKESPLWVPSCGKWVDDKGLAHITIGTAFETHIHYVANSRLGFVKDGWLNYKPGMHEFTIQVPEGDDQNISLTFHTYRDCVLYSGNAKLTYQRSANKLTLGLSAFRDKIVPGGRETWTFSLKNRDGKPVDGRLALEVISEAVNQLQPNRWDYKSDYILSYPASVSAKNIYPRYSSGSWQEKFLRKAKYLLPNLNFYNHYFQWGSGYYRENTIYTIVEDEAAHIEDVVVAGYASNRYMKQARAMSLASAAAPDAVLEMEGAVTLETGAGDAEENIYDNVRSSETKVALWQPNVDFGENGEVSVEFEVPSDNTTWRLNAFAFNSATESNALSQTMIAQRRVMVKPSLPRFLRSGDKTTLMANVMNSGEENVEAEITIILFDPRTGKEFDRKTFSEEIPAGGMKAVGIEAEAFDNLSHLGFRVVATSGGASDGEQQMIPVLPAAIPVVETIPFYLNPNDGDTVIEISHLPEAAEITYEYCNNPVRYCISALPTVYDAEITTATGLAHNLYAVSLAKGLAEKNPLIRKALEKMQKDGTAVPFDEETCKKLVKKLCDLQNADGGISWFDWQERNSSEYVTYQVLELLGELRHIGFLNLKELGLTDFVKNALKYYEREVQKNLAEMKKLFKKVDYTSFGNYLYLRTLYSESEFSLSSENAALLKKTLEACEKNWRDFSLPSRGYLAITLNRNGREKTARTIIESLRQFSMNDDRRGMFWDNLQTFGYSWYNRTSLTALMLEAFDEVDSRKDEIDQIRKWILLEKQTTDWGGSSMAAEATFALVSTGSEWLLSEDSEYSKEIIESRTPIHVSHKEEAPAWGAVYAKFPTQVSKTKAFSLQEISITKELRRHDGGKLKALKDVHVGDKIQIQLTVTTDRDMQYVTIRDHRASCFEPVDKKSGYRLSDSTVKSRQSIGYYNDTKDTETRLLIGFLPKGSHVITYDVYVTNSGTFSTGIAEITCEYAPQFTAHTAGEIFTTKADK